MPSSHTTFVTALATGVGLVEGFDTPIFALAAAFALVVMYDAAGVRRAAGKQAKVLNRIIDDIYKKTFILNDCVSFWGTLPSKYWRGLCSALPILICALGEEESEA